MNAKEVPLIVRLVAIVCCFPIVLVWWVVWTVIRAVDDAISFVKTGSGPKWTWVKK